MSFDSPGASCTVAPESLGEIDLPRLLEEAAREGARKALAEVGLHDEQAAGDIRELRGLLDAWRDTKRTARQTAVRWLIRLLLAAIAAGVAFKTGLVKLG